MPTTPATSRAAAPSRTLARRRRRSGQSQDLGQFFLGRDDHLCLPEPLLEALLLGLERHELLAQLVGRGRLTAPPTCPQRLERSAIPLTSPCAQVGRVQSL